ncbi:MAG: hypothetical protein OXB98_03700 [Bryobacterales bacterium]|nr:hypothetical protein [Bryobacterales bacterium]
MPFYKKDLAGAKNRSQSHLSEAMKRQALRARCPQCGRKSALKRVRLDASASMRVCRWADCGFEICP